MSEPELRENEVRLQAFEIETVGVIFFAPDGRITDANSAFLKMSGYNREDLTMGRLRWDQMTPEEWMPRALQAIDEFKRTGKTTTYEKEYIRKDGSRWWGLFSASRLTDDLGVEHIVDISDRKRAERELAASEGRFRQFAENSADVLWIIDAKTKQLEYLNPAYERTWGESREPIMRDLKRWEELVHPADRARVTGQLARVAQGGTFVNEYRIVRPSDGQIRWIRDTGFPMRGDDGQIQRLAGVAQDVTEDKNRTEALAESEERFRLLVDGAPDHAMFLLDPGNQIIYWSAGAERVFGWSANEVLGQSGELIFTPEDRARKQEEKEMQIALREGVASDRRWHLRKDRSRVWIDGVMRRLDHENGNVRGFAKIARDATELHRAEEELQTSHQDLEKRVRERTAQLTAMNEKLQAEMKERAQVEQEVLLVSEREKRRIGQDLHDSLCQELAAAALFLRTASHKMEKKSPSGAKVLEDAARIVNDNVGLARDLARGLHPVELSSSGLANALRELAFRTSQGRSVTCHFECPRQVRIRDEAVALNLYRITQESVANAVKNGKASTITIKLLRDRKELALTVKDNGKGFSTSNSRQGMGLHIMKYRADVIGARLTIESAEGQGALVTCMLPSE
jgi:PAS domain S-box-containing protein